MSGDPAERIERFHAACGGVMRASASMEAALTLYLKALLGVDETRARIVWRALPSPAARHECLERLGRTYLDDMPLRRLRKLLGEVAELGARRDWVTSAQGGVDSDTGTVALRADPGGSPPAPPSGFHILSVGEIEALAREIAGLEVELMGFLRTLAGAARAAPRV